MKPLKNDNNFLAILWIVLGVCARLIPHPANMTPITSLSLFGGTQMSKGRAFAVSFGALALSDILLAKFQGHDSFGMWSLFTYSGFAAILLAGSFLKKNPNAARTFSFLLASSFGFWLWTNFGTWISGEFSLYPRTLDGLVACYVAALPFLRDAMIGDLAWGAVFFLSFSGARKLAPKMGWMIQGA